MKSKFKVGDKVITDISQPDEQNLTYNKHMEKSSITKEILTVISVFKVKNGTMFRYELSNGWYYQDSWLTMAEPQTPYHPNPKIHDVIAKMKSLESRRKEQGYAF